MRFRGAAGPDRRRGLGPDRVDADRDLSTGIFDAGGAEIVAYDPESQRLFVVNAEANRLDVLDIRKPWAPARVGTIDFARFGGGINSVAVHDGIVAAAVENENKQAPGKVVLFDAAGTLLSSVTVGALPDMVTFSPNGSWLLVANEGEPLDYCAPGLANDPEGSVSVIDLRGGASGLTQAQVRTAGFAAFNNAIPAGVRVFGRPCRISSTPATTRTTRRIRAATTRGPSQRVWRWERSGDASMRLSAWKGSAA